jgi:bifunctional N-acetylglucosamine-1-phosphate-uridyltransferase/glucosamine-1-phosphate-acetyltransferase GlmU-like protein
MNKMLVLLLLMIMPPLSHMICLKKWCHIIFLTEKEKKILQNLCNKKERSRMFLFEVLTIMLQKVGKIKAISPHDMEIMKIDTSKQLQKIQDS